MAEVVLTLGDFAFSNLEIPESLPFGGSQALAVHKLPGGARVVQAMGRDDAPLTWSGSFLGLNALARARYLDGLRVAGKALVLAWSERRSNVVIQDFRPDFRQAYRIPYSITCVVVEDLAAPVTVLRDGGYDTVIDADRKTALASVAQINDSALTKAMATLDTAIKSVSTFAHATTATVNSVLGPLKAVQGQVSTLLASVTNTVTNVTTVGGIIPGNPVAKSLTKLTDQVNATAQLPRLYNLQSVLSRIGKNVNMAGADATARTVTVGGGTLYDVAAKQYGDATKWPLIAKANGTNDPQVTGVTTLNIPQA